MQTSVAPRRPFLWLSVAAFCLILDQLSKYYFNTRFEYGEIQPVIEGFWNWHLTYNRGAAFSFLADADGWQHYFFFALGTIVSSYLIWQLVKTPQSRLMDFAMSLVLSGVIGNLIDRALYGHVIDFIQWHYQNVYIWPTFNLADSAICLGMGLFIFLELFSKHPDASKN